MAEAARKSTPSVSPVAPPLPKKESTRPVADKTVLETPAVEVPRSHRLTLVLWVAFVLLCFAGYGVFQYVMPSKQSDKESTSELSSIEGLRILNGAGSVEPNGDLLISGLVENATDKERSAWYVVVDVFDAQGKVLSQIRLLNGKQIYTRKDYDVLAKRGTNIQELKTKILQEHGVIIPAKGSVPFELRYIQPPVGVASFNATLHPFDPVKLFKEIAEEAK
jgi:hypothetical protein